MPFGYNGRVLHVDLTRGELEVETPPEAFYREYAGGSAMGLYYLLQRMPPHADPLGPENILALTLSVLTGAPISGQSRLMANAKSPLTDAIGDSQAGGFFPAELKFAGYDAILLYGRAAHPVYLWVRDGQAELRDARGLWGLTTGEAERKLKEELGDPKIQVAQIGPAGEKLVRYAAIINMTSRANGRTGMGAVMGSKNLKAIAVRGTRGTQGLEFADRAGIIKLAQRGSKHIPENPDVAGLGKYGTAVVVAYQNTIGSLPTNNYDSGVFEGWEKISGETMYDTILRGAEAGRQNTQGRDTCYSCAVRCKRVAETEYHGTAVEPRYGGPEYETLSTFGSYTGVDDLQAVALASQMCNEYGVDTISAGATIAFAMDCYEHGLLTKEDTGGIELRYGNAEGMIEVFRQTLLRSTPLGDLLAEGSARAAARIGRGAEELAITVKKMELPAHMPQAKRSLGLIYAVNPFGADHQSSEHDPMYEVGNTSDLYLQRLGEIGLHDPQPVRSLGEEKVRFALKTEHFYSALDSYGLCQFVFGPAWTVYGPQQMAELVRLATGWDTDVTELMRVGEKRLNLLRAFNAREGIDRRADTLPKKLFRALKGGTSDGVKLDPAEMERAKDIYYEMSGWDVATGVPGRAKLEELGLGWIELEVKERTAA